MFKRQVTNEEKGQQSFSQENKLLFANLELERGEKNPSIESIYKLTKGLEIPITQLLKDIDIFECSNPNISLEIYHLCQELPEKKQKAIKKVLEEIITAWD